MEKESIADLTKKTAQNVFDLMHQLAMHIQKLEEENAELRSKLPDQSK